jgi:hypothetical protein
MSKQSLTTAALTSNNLMQSELLQEIKERLSECERLFVKLRQTGHNYENIEYDESGFYEDDETTALRHWDKLSSKVAQYLDENIESCRISRDDVQTPDRYCIILTIEEEDKTHLLRVNYSNEDELLIS